MNNISIKLYIKHVIKYIIFLQNYSKELQKIMNIGLHKFKSMGEIQSNHLIKALYTSNKKEKRAM